MQTLRNSLAPDGRPSLKRETAPSLFAVTLEEAKAHMRIDIPDDDSEINGQIQAATFDAESFINGPICTQTWIQKFDHFPACAYIELWKYPVQSISAIRYIDTADAQQTVATSVYSLDPDRNPSIVHLQADESWPDDCRGLTNDVEIEFVVGWAVVPKEIKQAVLIQVAEFYENRENGIIGTIYTPTKAYERLLSPHRNIKI